MRSFPHPFLRLGLIVLCLSAKTVFTWDGSLTDNRKLIITDASFTADKYILDQACIMIELYYHLDEAEALLFDPEAPEIVFGKISVHNLSNKQTTDSLNHYQTSLKNQIQALSATPIHERTESQKLLRKSFPPNWSPEQAKLSAERMVWRRGLRRAFKTSLENGRPYAPFMDSAFRSQGVPTRLKYLAYVESNFNPEAIASSGAAGIWQFIESSGSAYLTIDDRVDQRMDPLAASRAAAKFLKLCKNNLKSWPLAVMAYNNGPTQMLEAVKTLGSDNPSEIIQNFEGNGFGAVSKNYYAMFLAASSLGLQAETLYPTPKNSPKISFKTLKLEHEWTPRQLRILTGYSTAVIMKLNPALRPIVFAENLAVPKGFELILPTGMPTEQDLKFNDLYTNSAATHPNARYAYRFMAGFHVPRFVSNFFFKVCNTLPTRFRDEILVLDFIHSQGLLNAQCLALAKQDRILIGPHPALQAMIKGLGG